MPDLHDITEFTDIQQMVNSFYSKVRTDDFIGPIFNERIQDRWDEHLETLSRFWESILLETNRYNGRPFPPHANLPINKDHFERWLGLFIENIDLQFKGPNAEEAKLRAFNIAHVFMHKLESLRGESLE
ncbi:MAG TPA: group III truncated hemoglobin [Cytophagaceae bacterium]|jgi:hemoglobin|nr:group III truncated hemoglobin [Cytophagaceae bacterium]